MIRLQISNPDQGKVSMGTTPERNAKRIKAARRLLLTLAISAPVVFWMAGLFG